MKKIITSFVAILFITTSIITFAQEKGTFKDKRDGKTYETVKIGTQTWMSENLAYETSSGSWAYDSDESNINKYGRLYNWATATNVCPTGWHLPSNDEWATLTNYLGGKNVAGEKLKSSTGWNLSKDKNHGNNISNFSALPGGLCTDAKRTIYQVGKMGYWWSCPKHGTPNSYRIWSGDTKVYIGEISRKSPSFSVRCVKDKTKEELAIKEYENLIKNIENRDYNIKSKVIGMGYERDYTIITNRVRTKSLNYDVRKVLGIIADAMDFGESVNADISNLKKMMKDAESYLDRHYYGKRKTVYK